MFGLNCVGIIHLDYSHHLSLKTFSISYTYMMAESYRFDMVVLMRLEKNSTHELLRDTFMLNSSQGGFIYVFI